MSSEPLRHYDVIVAGGGHNGLVCACYLARQGLRVCVVEKRNQLGGASITEEFHPGFKNSVYSYAVSLLNPKIISDLELSRHGLKIIELGYNGIKRFVPISPDDHLLMPVDLEGAAAAAEERHPGDGRGLLELMRRLSLSAEAMRDIALDTPPNVTSMGFRDFIQAAITGNRLRKLSPEARIDLIKLMTCSVADYLSEFLGGEAILGLLAYSAAVGNMQSPYMPGSAYVLLHHVFGEVNGKKGKWGHAIGGQGAISDALVSSAKEAGVEFSIGSGIKEVTTNGKSVNGVLLDNGNHISAKIIASSLNPKLLFERLVDSGLLAPEFKSRMKNWRCISGTFRMNVALSELPEYSSMPGRDPSSYRAASVITASSLAYLERGYDDAKHGGWSKQPIVEMQIPSLYDETLAPKGKHVASLFCQFFHPNLSEGRTWDDCAPIVADHIINYLNSLAPNFKSSIVGMQIKSPLDIERDLGMLGGDIFHGAMHLDQTYSMRPAAGYAAYRGPIDNLYLCGSGSHPGGGVSGLPGHNAAREIIKDLRYRKVRLQ